MSKIQRDAIAAIAVALLSLSVMSAAQAGQGSEQTPAAGTTLKKHPAQHKDIYNATQTPVTMTPKGAYNGYFTRSWEDPDYYGSNGG